MLKDNFYVIKINDFYVSEIKRNYNFTNCVIIGLELTKYLADAKIIRNYNLTVDVLEEIKCGEICKISTVETLHREYKDLE